MELLTLIAMRVPHRERRSLAQVPLAGSCLAAGLSSLVAVDEVVLAGVRIPAAPRPCTLMHVRRGRQRLLLDDGRRIDCQAGCLLAWDEGLRSEVRVESAFDASYVIVAGPWRERLVPAFAAGGLLLDLRPPAVAVQALEDLVRHALARGDGWDWAALAAFATVAGHLQALARRGGGGSLAERVGRLVDAAPGEAWPLERLAEALGLGQAAFVHRFRSENGEGPAMWLRRRRMDHARRLLRQGQRPIAVAAALGYAGLPQFSRAFRRTLGLRPSGVAPG